MVKIFGVALAVLIIGGAGYYLTRTPKPQNQDVMRGTPAQAVRPNQPRPLAVPGNEFHGPHAVQPISPARKQFQNLTQEAFKTLPKQTDPGAQDPKSLEHPSEELIARLKPLIDIDKAIKGNPELVDDGIYFYRQCALHDGFHMAVRARCLSHYLSLSRQHNKPVTMQEFDERLQKLARAFPN